MWTISWDISFTLINARCIQMAECNKQNAIFSAILNSIHAIKKIAPAVLWTLSNQPRNTHQMDAISYGNLSMLKNIKLVLGTCNKAPVADLLDFKN